MEDQGPGSRLRDRLPKPFSRETKLAVLGVAALVAATTLLLYSSSYGETVVLDNSTRLEQIDDNRVGYILVNTNSDLPFYYRKPDFTACIYTSGQEAPLILPVELEETGALVTEPFKELDLLIDLPEKELGRENLTQNFKLEIRDQCPVRSEPKIVIKRED